MSRVTWVLLVAAGIGFPFGWILVLAVRYYGDLSWGSVIVFETGTLMVYAAPLLVLLAGLSHVTYLAARRRRRRRAACH
jgi:hypothetical protein